MVNARVDLAFANRFIEMRIAGFRKDMAICLTPDKDNSHAYFPALMTCSAHLELFAGLRAGNLDLGVGALKAIESFRTLYLPMGCYTNENLAILHRGCRHRIAHVGAPNVVHKHDGKHITWSIYEIREGKPALELVPQVGTLKVTPTPWPVRYDHRFHISLPAFQNDLEIAVASYQRDLAARSDLQALFSRAIEPCYPT